MNVQVMKRQMERLSPIERAEIESFLKTKRIAETSAFQQRFAAAQGRMDEGIAINSIELRAILNTNPPAEG